MARDIDRRSFVAATGLADIAALAGCTGDCGGHRLPLQAEHAECLGLDPEAVHAPASGSERTAFAASARPPG